MWNPKVIMKGLALAASATLAFTATAELYFGHGFAPGGASYGTGAYEDFAPQGRFFASTDHGFVPGGEDQLTGGKLGIKNYPGSLYKRGQAETKEACSYPLWCFDHGWLSDGGKTVFGLTFEQPFKPAWDSSFGDQFARFPDKTPLFDRAVVHWGFTTPKPGSWGACVQNADGDFKRLPLDNQRPVHPFDKTTVNFPPTSVKTLYFGIEGAGDNFASVQGVQLLLHNPKLLDNRPLVFQLDAYRADYSPTQPGMVYGLQVANAYSKYKMQNRVEPHGSDYLLTDLSPFIELDGKRHLAAQGDYPVETSQDGAADLLGYTLKFALPEGKTAKVKVKARFSVELKDTVTFQYRAEGLPEGARLGFQMSGKQELFANYADNGATVVEAPEANKLFATPAGPLGFATEGAGKLVTTRSGTNVRFDLFADGDELNVALSLPLGPNGGVQPGMLNYNWRPSLANQGDAAVAPFESKDLELLETVNLADPNDPHEVYDITNDPLILNWRKSGERRLPGALGHLNHISDPVKGAVPTTTVLGEKCRAINSANTTYFRFNLNARFAPQVPYLIVVEHAFDQERRGEFHGVLLDQTGRKLAGIPYSPAPVGGFDTGKPPYDKAFKKESVFFFYPEPWTSDAKTTFSLCFSNDWQWNHGLKRLPEGLAVKTVSVYRVTHMPELPSHEKLTPEGLRRHVTVHAENLSPWTLQQFPGLAGYNSVWANHQNPAQLLHGKQGGGAGHDSWHPGTLASQRWLFDSAERNGVSVKVFLNWLLALGGCEAFEGHNTTEGPGHPSVPLRPTPEELELIGAALDKSLDALAPYKSFDEISTVSAAMSFFTKRNLDDFSRETGVKFQSSPVPRQNLNALLASDKATVDAWAKWSGHKRLDFLEWVLKKARKRRPDIVLTLNQSWMVNSFQQAFYGANTGWYPRYAFDREALTRQGIDNFHDFLKFVCHDPALYVGKDGFGLALEHERGLLMAVRHDGSSWPSPYQEPWFAKLRDSFEAGLSIQSPVYDESSKPLSGWTCNYVKDRRSFRRDLVEALLHANARDVILQTYYQDPYRGRLDDLRSFAVPFQLLPFAKPEAFAGKISDTAKQAVIKKYGDRHGLVNAGDKPTDVMLTLPEGADKLYDLSNGVRQELLLGAPIHLEPWSLKTLELK